ncbi:MAG: hypothetical protein M3P44_06720 [Actinomycetota bacterium]|nr:hypothetical protein [Actinomycetota bacterium]
MSVLFTRITARILALSIRCLSGPIGGDVGFVLAAGVQQQRAQLVVLELALPLVGKR